MQGAGTDLVGRAPDEGKDVTAFKNQARRAFTRIQAILEASGSSFADVVMINSFHVWTGPNSDLTRDEQFDADRFGLWLEVLLESGGDLAAQTVAKENNAARGYPRVSTSQRSTSVRVWNAPSTVQRVPYAWAACKAVACSGDRLVRMWISVSPLSVGRSRQSVIRRTKRVLPSKCNSMACS